MSLKSSIGSPTYQPKPGSGDPNNSAENNLNMWGKSRHSGVKTRSNNAMFGGETLVQQQERIQVEQEYAPTGKAGIRAGFKEFHNDKSFIEIPYLRQ
jgi:hypothetical protein